ncbi:exonuclease domain-containing protein [Streptomyces sp. NPDC127051]|uniref:exonuclease domain-containing protein n=1 Tax=Streptomyces sp. NPDC127051 TaxID=3347119 RepID=UPI00364732BC
MTDNVDGLFGDDADRDDPLASLRIPVTSVSARWPYIACFDGGSERRPTDSEAGIPSSFIEEYKTYWFNKGYRRKTSVRALDVDSGCNTTIFHKWADEGWSYRVDGQRRGPVWFPACPDRPGGRAHPPYTLVQLMDRIRSIARIQTAAPLDRLEGQPPRGVQCAACRVRRNADGGERRPGVNELHEPSAGCFGDVRRLAFDTETTGPNPHEARILTATLIARGGGLPDRAVTWLINPGVPIPAEATAVHGIDDVQAAAGAVPGSALNEIATHVAMGLACGMPVVAFNLSFNWTVLACELVRYRLPTVAERLAEGAVPWLIDPHVIDRQYDRYVKGSGRRKLKPTADRYGIKLRPAHTAKADALAALLIAEKQFERYPQLDSMSPAQLFAAQKAWRAEQQAGLQDWFRTEATPEQGGDPNKAIPGDWPLIPRRETGA